MMGTVDTRKRVRCVGSVYEGAMTRVAGSERPSWKSQEGRWRFKFVNE